MSGNTAFLNLASNYDFQKVEGLTCDENDYLYEAGKGIVQREIFCCFVNVPDPASCCFGNDGWDAIYLGDLPPGMECLGDITYRQGKFYLSAVGNKLVEVNMKDPSKSKVVYQFPPGTLPIHGLTTVQVSCDSATTYAVGRSWDHSVIYELNFSDWSLTEVCDMPLNIAGLGNITECALPPCDIFVDMDHDNSSFGFWGNYCADTFCLPPMAVTDTDVVILSMAGTLDSLRMELADTPDGAAEYLEAFGIAGSLSLTGNGTQALTFVNSGNATLEDFEAAMKAVRYQNQAPVPTYGMRKVFATAWLDDEQSLVSTAELPLSNAVLKIQAQATSPSCHGFSDGTLSVAVSGGYAPYSLQWAAGGTDTLLAGLAAGSYPLVVTDSSGCMKTDTFTLTGPEPLLATIANAGPAAVCDDSGSLSASAEGGTQPYGFNWSNGTTGPLNEQLTAGSYLLTVTDQMGCTDSTAFFLPAGDTVLVQEFVSICEGESYSWNTLLLTRDTAICEVFNLADGCDSTSCLYLTVHPLPVAEIDTSGSLCNGGQVQLSVGNAFAAQQWNNGETAPTLTVLEPGYYSVTVTDPNGCTSATEAVVVPPVSFEVEASDPSCHGFADGSLTIHALSGVSPFQYSTDLLHFSDENEYSGLAAGNYLVAVRDATGCLTTQPVVLNESAPVFLEAGPDQSIQLGEEVILNAQTNLTNPVVSWQPPDFLGCPTCLNTTAQPHHSLQYTITVESETGCPATDSLRIEVEGGGRAYVPTAFSPNGDGVNDRLTVFTDRSVVQILSLQVFDRWGGLVFETKNIPPNEETHGWDGTAHGKQLPAGLYVYQARLLLLNGIELLISGEVMLVR